MHDHYLPLKEASIKISGGSDLAEELLHYTLDSFLRNPKLEEILEAGAGRWFCVKIMMNSFRSVTSPFYHTYRNNPFPLHEAHEAVEEEDPTEELAARAKALLGELPWYDRMLFQTFVEDNHTVSSLARSTGIPRTSVSLTINRVRRYLKKNI
jgi:hypothetical protein